MNRGDVVIVNFSPSAPTAGVRPALVVQNDRDNTRTINTIVVQITSNTRRANEPTQLLIDPNHPDWASSGLRLASVVNCSNLTTIQQADVRRVMGSLSSSSMAEVDECLKAALQIP